MDLGHPYHDDVFISILPVAAPLLLVPVQLNLHLGHVFEAAFPAERVPGRRRLDVTLHALPVREVGAPFHELRAGAETLVRRVRVDDVEDYCLLGMPIGPFELAFFFSLLSHIQRIKK